MDGRHRYRGCAVLTVMLVSFSLQTALVISQDCTYLYTEQPPNDIDCNPYVPTRTDEKLELQCALTAPAGSGVSLNWYHNGANTSNNATELPLETNLLNGMDTFRSVLTLRDPQPEVDSGEYYCQAVVGDEDLLPSESFILSSDRFEYFNEVECVSMETFFTTATKCADVSPTDPVTTPTAPPPQPTTSQPTLPTTLTPSQTIASQPILGETTGPSSSAPPTDPNTTTTITGGGGATTDSGTQDPLLQTWIYVLVGVAAVFGMIIVILTIMCVGLCLKRNKTHDSQTLKHNGRTLGSSMVSNEMYNSTENNFSSSPPQYPGYSSLAIEQNREYEVVGFMGSRPEYSHLHRPSPPPLPNTLPSGRSATMTEDFRSANTLPSDNTAEPDYAPTLPPKGTVPDHHVYRELEKPVSCSLTSSSPPMSAHVFERGDSTAQLLPGGPFSKANGGPYRKFSGDSVTLSVNESLYSPTTPNGTFTTPNGLEDIPETGMSFVEPDDPTAFPVHEYEVIPARQRKTKNYESPVPDEGHAIGGNPQGHAIGGNPQGHAIGGNPQGHAIGGNPQGHAIGGNPQGHAIGGNPQGHAIGGNPQGHAIGGNPQGHAIGGNPQGHAIGGNPQGHAIGGNPQGHAIGGNPQGHAIGGNPQTRVSVKSANYETDPQLEGKPPTRGINPYDSTRHFSVSSAELSRNSGSGEVRKMGEPVTSSPALSPPPSQVGGVASDYSRLHFKDGNYSKLGSRNGEKFDPDFFKNASEICLSSNGINTHHFSNSNGGSTLYDSDHSSRDNSPPSSGNRGQSIPLTPPPIYPVESKYNQLTLPGFQAPQFPVCVNSQTTL